MKPRLFIKGSKDNLSIEEFVRDCFKSVKISDIELQHTALGTRIIVYTTTPGLVIGKGGEKIRSAVEEIKKSFKIENPQIDVQRVQSPYLDPNIVAQNVIDSIERGVSVKRLGDFYLNKIIGAGAIGCEILLSGKFSGQRARRERFVAGYVKKCGNPARKDVLRGRAVATTKLGSTGVNVSIMLRKAGFALQLPEEQKPEEKEEQKEKEQKPEEGQKAKPEEPQKPEGEPKEKEEQKPKGEQKQEPKEEEKEEEEQKEGEKKEKEKNEKKKPKGEQKQEPEKAEKKEEQKEEPEVKEPKEKKQEPEKAEKKEEKAGKEEKSEKEKQEGEKKQQEEPKEDEKKEKGR